jgi:hypothetical protein
MLANLMAALTLPELRKRIQFVFLMFAVFMVGLHIPVPGINRAAMERLVNSTRVRPASHRTRSMRSPPPSAMVPRSGPWRAAWSKRCVRSVAG